MGNVYRDLKKEFGEMVQKFREECEHPEVSGWLEEQWSPGHPTGFEVKSCRICGETVARRTRCAKCGRLVKEEGFRKGDGVKRASSEIFCPRCQKEWEEFIRKHPYEPDSEEVTEIVERLPDAGSKEAEEEIRRGTHYMLLHREFLNSSAESRSMKDKKRAALRDGLFVAVEGIDGSGKSLLVEKLKVFFEDFEECNIVFLKEPTDFLGREIKANRGEKFNAELSALLFAADRLKQYDETTREVLDDGGVVISDRSVVSSLVYQRAAGVPFDWLEVVNRYVRFPDLVILLDLPSAKSIERIADRGETTRLEGAVNRAEFQRRVRGNYLELAEKHRDSFYILRSDHYSPKDLAHMAGEEILDRIRPLSGGVDREG